MIQMPMLDNKWLTPTPKKGADKALSVEPRTENETSPLSDVSATSANNKGEISSRNDFQSTLKTRIESPASHEDQAVEGREWNEDDSSSNAVSLSDSDTATTAPATNAPAALPAVSKVKSAKGAVNQAQAMEHRLAWNDFLHKMRAKLGISAQDILKAFKSLTQEELKQSPEKNVGKLIQQLGLNDQQAVLAHQFFKELIMRTGDTPLNQEAKLDSKTGALAMMSQREQHQQKTEQSLQKMNQQFFMKAPPAQPSKETGIPEMKDASKDLAAISSGDTSKIQAAPGGIAIPSEVMKASQASDQVSAQSLQSLSEMKAPTPAHASHALHKPEMMEPPPEETSAFTAPQPSMASMVTAPKMMAKNISAAPAANFDPTANVTPSVAQTPIAPIPVAPMAPTLGGSHERNRDDASDDSTDNAILGADETAAAGHHAFSIDAKNVDGGADLKKAMPTMAVPDLVQQAHVMVKDGGGEMKVVLTPEGLGEVAMKVSVKDGKVNVEMITQSDEAKKVLENSFHALRDGLNAHHLNLETIKVDTASNLGTQLEQQYKDAQRHQAQQFLEQFHQDNRGWRQSFFDIPGAQVYRSQTQRTPVGPAVASKSSSRRLDLVA